MYKNNDSLLHGNDSPTIFNAYVAPDVNINVYPEISVPKNLSISSLAYSITSVDFSEHLQKSEWGLHYNTDGSNNLLTAASTYFL